MADLVTGAPREVAVLGIMHRLEVAEPASAEELSRTLAAAGAARQAVIPWGGGAAQAFGRPPARADLLLSLRGLRGIVRYRPEDLTLSVLAGTSLAEIAEALAAHGQFLPLDLPAPAAATIGGAVATALPPLRRLRYGAARDLVIGVEVALANGERCKAGGDVVKNVAGYDLCKLFTGSLGSLGVLSRINVKVQPLPRREAVVYGVFDECDAAVAAGRSLARAGIGFGAVVLTQRSSGAPCTLFAFAEGFPGAVSRQCTAATAAMEQAGGEASLEDGAELAAALRAELLGWRVEQDPETAVMLRVSAPPASLLNAWSALDAALGALPIDRAYQADLAAGQLLARLTDMPASAASALPGALGGAREALRGHAGRLVVVTAPAALRAAVDPWDAPPDGAALARNLKATLDPAGTLNPGRFAYGV